LDNEGIVLLPFINGMGCGKSEPQKAPTGLKVNAPAKALNLDGKLVLLGDSGVGKSSIAMRYVNNVFSEAFEVTIGGGYLQQIVRLRDGSSLKLDIWDTGGQERYRALLQLYYRDADAALITYDVSNARSLENCEYWVNELRRTEENCILCLVANKIDLPAEEKKVEQRAAHEFVEKFGMIHFETSAKTGENVNKLFEAVAQEIVKKKNQMG
jgi:small GTP-binding protein